jgi:protein TonB
MMFTDLIESRQRRQRGGAGTVVSVMVHAGVIGLATAATIRARPAPPIAARVDTLIFIPTTTPAAPTTPVKRSGGSLAVATTGAPPLPPAPIGTVELPVPTPASDHVIDEPIVDAHDFWSTGASPRGGAPVPDQMDGSFRTVDKPAVPIGDAPRPEYPAPLRDARVEATVGAEFVVDTAGRVVPNSIVTDLGANPLFVQSIRAALQRYRFLPAEVGDRRVKVRMRQEFTFRLDP